MRSSLILGSCVLFVAGCGGANPFFPDGSDTPRPRHEDYIRGDRFPRLLLEVDSVQGMAPRASSQEGLLNTLRPLLDKPGGITVQQTDSLSSRGADHAWTDEELDALANQTFDRNTPADTISMHVMFVDGHSADDSSDGKILGLAWGQTHLVIFKQTIEDACRSGLNATFGDRVCEEAEQGVWTHEVGHLLGLVDNGVPMVTPHVDSSHPAHDQNKDCVMYWAWETGGLFDQLRTAITNDSSAPLDFDAECKTDLAAVRNRKD